jgi:hypothetical protein
MTRISTGILVCALVCAMLWPLAVLGASDFTTASEMVQSDDETGKAWAEYIVRNAGAKTDEEKIRAVYDMYTNNMEYDRDALVAVRDLPASEHALRIPRYDYLSVLTSVAEYTTGKSKSKPKSLCGGYTYGIAGSLRALGIPVKIEIGKLDRAARKGESYFDADGKKRISAGKGEAFHRYLNGRWVRISDIHARLSIWVESLGRWLSADPTFDSVAGGGSYFDMDAAKYAERWILLYVSQERMPRAWANDFTPRPVLPPPPEPLVRLAWRL